MPEEWINPPVTVSMVARRSESNEILICYHAERDLWDLPGGFLDPGETLEQCALRELREETTIPESAVSQIQYLWSVPTLYYDGRRILSVYFECVAPKDCEVLPTSEVQSFKWIDCPPRVGELVFPKCDFDAILLYYTRQERTER